MEKLCLYPNIQNSFQKKSLTMCNHLLGKIYVGSWLVGNSK